MSRYHSYIASATRIIDSYDGSKPLVHHLKVFFAAGKQFGSRDRKMIASLCYCYFRVGHLFKDFPLSDRIVAGFFICESEISKLLEDLRPDLNAQITLPVAQKLKILNIESLKLFPFSNELSREIEPGHFALSFVKQPHLYIRIRPGRKAIVLNKLKEASINAVMVQGDCLQFNNTTALNDVLSINRDVVIQDRNSQFVLNYLNAHPDFFSKNVVITAWDACAASGGKSILLFDQLKGRLQLTVSDIRESILQNLSKRLQQARVPIYMKFVANLTDNSKQVETEQFSIIVCDAPCTGSGTWSRTPEQLYYFNEKSISEYAQKQKKIVANIVPRLAQGGLLFYITCSVFEKENEEVVSFIKETFPLRLLQMEYLKGYNYKADTLFVAVFSH